MTRTKTVLGPVTGWSRGERLKSPYQAVLIQDPDKAPIISIEQEIDGAWYATPGRWFVETLGVERDRIALDYGQGWWVTGIRLPLAHARKILATQETAR